MLGRDSLVSWTFGRQAGSLFCCRVSAATAGASAAVAATAIAAPASAQWYIGGGIGQSGSSDANQSGTVSGVPYNISDSDSHKTSYQLSAGYQFTPMWGMELQYTDLGKRNSTINFGAPLNASAALSEARAYQWGISATGTFPIANNFFVRGKLGVSDNHLEATSGTFTSGGVGYTVHSDSGSKADVLAGIAIGYEWNKNISTRLEYEYFGKFGDDFGGKGDNIGLNMQYKF